MPVVIGQSKPVAVFYVSPLLSAGTNANAIQVSGAGTTAKIFPVPNSVVPAGGTSQPAVVLLTPGSYRLEGEPFLIKAGGVVYTHGTSPTLAVALYYVNNTTYNSSAFQLAQTTPASWTLAHTTATPATPTTGTIVDWAMTATMQGDSQSGVLAGNVTYTIGNTAATTPAAVTNTLTLNTGIAGGMYIEPPAVFGVGLTFGVSDALNVGQMNYFYIEG